VNRRSRFLYWVFSTLFELLSEVQIEGQENIPESGPCIVAANHIHVLDVPLGYVVFRGENVTGWAAEKYSTHPIFGPIVRFGGGTFIQRGQVDRSAMQSALGALKMGKIFGLSPEGTRSKDGVLQRGKTGIAFMADQAGVPVLPMAIIDTDIALRTLLRFRRPTMTVRFGQFFNLPHLDEADRTGSLRRNTDEVMCQIAALLPPERRGYYADHPRLKELLFEADEGGSGGKDIPS
jgi:1-acyl-sn-glycerol-3-phosphate acyltransferase